ncbi:MAG: hypothetical protein JWO36_5602 [Myxococcales bacterium]|nr:hypothetical protein [Myxococcales bacterium]
MNTRFDGKLCRAIAESSLAAQLEVLELARSLEEEDAHFMFQNLDRFPKLQRLRVPRGRLERATLTALRSRIENVDELLI